MARSKDMTTTAPATHSRTARRTAAFAVGAGVLQFTGVAGEWVFDPQQPDGTVTNPLVFSLLLGASIAGTVCLLVALFGVRAMHTSVVPMSRTGRIGVTLSIAANALLLGFAIVVLVTALVTGAPAEASFVLFGLGMLLAVVVYGMLSAGLRRARLVGPAWVFPAVASVGIVIALVVPVDPWHDLGLFLFYAAWVGFGVLLGRRGAAAPPTRVLS